MSAVRTNTQCMICASVVMLSHDAAFFLQQHTVYDSCVCCYVVPRCHFPAAKTPSNHRKYWMSHWGLCSRVHFTAFS